GAFAAWCVAGATFAWYDPARWVKGRHSFAFGGAFERARFNQNNLLFQNGTYSFTGDITGNALADFMMGRLRTFTQGWGSLQKDRNILFSLFVQATFKLDPRLSLSYGLRFDPAFPCHDTYPQPQSSPPHLPA